MKLSVALLASAAASALAVSPIGKVLQLVTDLQAKVLKEGEQAQKVYSEYTEWCEDRARSIGFSIKTATGEVEELTASIAEYTSTVASLGSKIETLASDIATDEADLKAALEIRVKESADFSKEEAELTETISVLERAVAVLEREMHKGGASMLQVKNAKNLAQALGVLVQASSISSADAKRLTAFVQSTASDEAAADEVEDEVALGAPPAAVYKGHGGDIIETLQGLLEKAEAQLDDLRNKETSGAHNFEMLQQSLEDEVKVANKDMDDAKKGVASNGESKASAEGDLETTSKDLATDTEAKGDLHQSCMTKAEDFEAETKSRGEELGAIAGAKLAIQEVSGDASLSQLSFVQTRRAKSTTSGSNFQVVRIIRGLARKHGSAELSLLATKISSQMHLGGPFDKVKAMISDMLGKLEDAAGSDAKKKAHCDKEIAETTDKKEDKTDDLESLTTKLESSTAKSAQLKEELSVLQKEISALIKSQAEMDKMRSGEKATFEAMRTELETSLDGIKKAVKILNDYYGGSAEHATSGSSGGVIALLETVESDLSKNLAEITSEEESSVQNYKTTTNENQVEKATMEQDVKFKTKEAKELDKTASELTGDRGSLSDELDAVTEYLGRIQSDCSGKVESYEETVRRRAAEIQGLKQALETLQSDASFIQQSSSRRTRRGDLLRGSALTPSSA